MKKVTFISQFFPPDFAATGQLLDRLTIKLSYLGIKLVIFSGMPFYAFKNKRVNRYEYKNNRLILRTRFSTFFGKKFYGRGINSFLFTINALYNLLFIYPKSDLLIFTTEPPFLPFIAIVNYFLKKTKYLLIIYDSYPNILFENKLIKKENLIIKFWLFLNKNVYKNAEKIILLSKPMAEKFADDYPSSKEKIEIIPSWANVNTIKPLPKENNWFIKKHKLINKFVILYSGNQGRCHDIQTILDAALRLKNHEKILFLFIGGGYQNKLITQFKNINKLNNIELLGYQDYEDLPFSLTSGDLALVSIAEGAANLVAPSKLYGHLAAGTPIGVISPANSYLEKLVTFNKIGKSFRNGESKKLKEWILNLYEDEESKIIYSENSREFIINNFTEEIITKKYYDVIHSIIGIH